MGLTLKLLLITTGATTVLKMLPSANKTEFVVMGDVVIGRHIAMGDVVIGSFAAFSLLLSSLVTFTLTSFFSTILNSGVRFVPWPYCCHFLPKEIIHRIMTVCELLVTIEGSKCFRK